MTDLRGKHTPHLFEVTTTSQSHTLDPTISYELRHLGVSDDATSDTNAVVWSGGTAVATAGDFLNASADRGYLASGVAMEVGPGLKALNLICAAGSPIVQVTPLRHVTS